jgi:hypothetical protein
MIQGSNEQRTSTLNLRLRRCKPRRLSMLDRQLTLLVEGEEEPIPPQKKFSLQPARFAPRIAMRQ